MWISTLAVCADIANRKDDEGAAVVLSIVLESAIDSS